MATPWEASRICRQFISEGLRKGVSHRLAISLSAQNPRLPLPFGFWFLVSVLISNLARRLSGGYAGAANHGRALIGRAHV